MRRSGWYEKRSPAPVSSLLKRAASAQKSPFITKSSIRVTDRFLAVARLHDFSNTLLQRVCDGGAAMILVRNSGDTSGCSSTPVGLPDADSNLDLGVKANR